MTNYVTGSMIKELRTKKGYTQKQLADILGVSDKAVSKWETQKGLPDISLLEPIAGAFQVSLTELLSGECITNQNRAGNMLRTKFYVCPVCGNVIHTLGEGVIGCCGITLPAQEAEMSDEAHKIHTERMDGEYYVAIPHEMTKKHYISFLAYVTSSRIQLVKLYPEQSPEARFQLAGRGMLYAFCNQHGLLKEKI